MYEIVFKYLSHVIIYNVVTMVTGAVTATKLQYIIKINISVFKFECTI